MQYFSYMYIVLLVEKTFTTTCAIGAYHH